jgi:acylglycerol lipase
VVGIYLRCWGQSEGQGRIGYVRSYDEYVADVETAWQEVRTRFPGKPLFLQGDSLGGTVVLLASSLHAIPYAGLILNAPAVRPNPGLGFIRAPDFLAGLGIWAAGTAGKVWPDFPTLPVANAFTHAIIFDEQARQRFIKDPLCMHGWLPAAYITALSEASSRLQDNLGNVQDPLLVLQGGKDNLVPPSSSEFLMAHVGSKDKLLKTYEGMSLGTLEDAGKEEVWADIISWLGTTLYWMQPPSPVATAPAATDSAAASAGGSPGAPEFSVEPPGDLSICNASAPTSTQASACSAPWPVPAHVPTTPSMSATR